MIQFKCKPMNNWRMTSKFGPRSTGIVGASTMHNGVDGVGTPHSLILVADGRLEKKWWNDYRGWTCQFDIGKGYSVLYQHMRDPCPLTVGTIYKAGTIVGQMGASRSTQVIPAMAAHLHFELHQGGRPIDPQPYIEEVIELTEADIKKLVKTEVEKQLKGQDTKPSSWAQAEISEATKLGITDGSRPGGYATREETIAMILRSRKGK